MKTIKNELRYVSPGLKTQVITIAETDNKITSRHTNSIENENFELDRNINELDEGTKARNRAFQQRLDEIWSLTSGWEAKLKTEAIESAESIINLKNEYQIQIDNFKNNFLENINNIFNKFDNELIPLETNRIDVIDKDVDNFYKIIAPNTLEQQAGLLNKELKKTYEIFHIEQLKEKKRNSKFIKNVNLHLQKTSQKFNDELALIDSFLFTLHNNIIDIERPLIHIYQYKFHLYITNIIELKNKIKLIINIRKNEDLDVLDTVIETQKLLQMIVLIHFGSDIDNNNIDMNDKNEVKFPKLFNRMNTINNKNDNKLNAIDNKNSSEDNNNNNIDNNNINDINNNLDNINNDNKIKSKRINSANKNKNKIKNIK